MQKEHRFGGWIAYSFKDPETILESIWRIARVDFTGLRGLSEDENTLEFSGIRIRKKNYYPEDKGKNGELELIFEITDATEIQPEFLDLWDFLVANDILFGKLSNAERKMILASIASSNKKENVTEGLSPEINAEEDKFLFPWEGENMQGAELWDKEFIKIYCTVPKMKDWTEWGASEASRKKEKLRKLYLNAGIPKGKKERRLLRQRYEKREHERKDKKLAENYK